VRDNVWASLFSVRADFGLIYLFLDLLKALNIVFAVLSIDFVSDF
jgi:hypothetical protein